VDSGVDSTQCAVGSDASSTQCASCGRGCEPEVKLKTCSRCKSSFYCGEDCQRKHWKQGHKSSSGAPPGPDRAPALVSGGEARQPGPGPGLRT
jgi:hypothetical protein